MEHHWNTAGTALEHRWNTPGIPLEHPWNTLEHSWNTPGTLLEHSWNTLEHSWNTAGTTLGNSAVSDVHFVRFLYLCSGAVSTRDDETITLKYFWMSELTKILINVCLVGRTQTKSLLPLCTRECSSLCSALLIKFN